MAIARDSGKTTMIAENLFSRRKTREGSSPDTTVGELMINNHVAR